MPDAPSLQTLQLIRKGVLLVAILTVVVLAAFTGASPKSDAIQTGFVGVGPAMIGIAIIGRAWCSLYIGGRKAAEIVDKGPYSVTRNPLYGFSFIAAFGMGLQTGSLVLAGLGLLIAVGVFFATVKREEAWLPARFGEIYGEYRRRTPRFCPRFSAWRDLETLQIRPDRFVMTLKDGAVFCWPCLFSPLWLASSRSGG